MSEEIIQGSPEWFAQRCGKITASKMKDVLSGEDKAGYRNYRAQLVAERMTGKVEESYKNSAMQWGIDHEDECRTSVEMKLGILIDQVSFVDHPTLHMCGASPDGLTSDAVIELKCPNTATHLEYILNNRMPPEYMAQIQWQMAVCGKKKGIFASYDPRLPEKHQLFTIEVKIDETMRTRMIDAVIQLNNEVDDIIKKLENGSNKEVKKELKKKSKK